MKTFLIIIILTISGLYFIEYYFRDYEMVCVDKRIVKWVGVCDRYAICVVGFKDGSVKKDVSKPYINEERCFEDEFRNMKGLK